MTFVDELPFELLGVVIIGFMVIVPLALLASWITAKINKNPKNEFDMLRQEANLEVIALLKKYVKDNPSQRLGQAMRNVGILLDVGVRDSSKPTWETPDYYIDRNIVHEEPCVILDRVKQVLRK